MFLLYAHIYSRSQTERQRKRHTHRKRGEKKDTKDDDSTVHVCPLVIYRQWSVCSAGHIRLTTEKKRNGCLYFAIWRLAQNYRLNCHSSVASVQLLQRKW